MPHTRARGLHALGTHTSTHRQRLANLGLGRRPDRTATHIEGLAPVSTSSPPPEPGSRTTNRLIRWIDSFVILFYFFPPPPFLLLDVSRGVNRREDVAADNQRPTHVPHCEMCLAKRGTHGATIGIIGAFSNQEARH